MRRTSFVVFALVGMTSPGKQATVDLTRGYSKASSINRKEIAIEVGDNIELQTLVLGWIKDYKQQAAAAGGRSVAELVGNRHQINKDVLQGEQQRKRRRMLRVMVRMSPLRRRHPGFRSSLKTLS